MRSATNNALPTLLCNFLDALRDPRCKLDVLLVTLRVASDSRDLIERAELQRLTELTSRTVQRRARRVFAGAQYKV